MRTVTRSDSDPCNRAFSITPSDSVDVAFPGCRLYVGTTGNLAVTLHSENSALTGDTVTFANVPVGWVPLRVQRVFSTATTAANIIGVWTDH